MTLLNPKIEPILHNLPSPLLSFAPIQAQNPLSPQLPNQPLKQPLNQKKLWGVLDVKDLDTLPWVP